MHLQVDVVVGRRHQDPGLLHACGDDRLQVVERGPHPGGDLGTRALLARGDCLPINRRVREKLRLPDDRPAQFGEQIIEMNDLVDGVRGARLLTIAERRVGDPDLRGPGLGNAGWFETDGRDSGVGEIVAEQVRLGRIDHAPFYAYIDLACNMLTAALESRRLGAG